MSAYVDNVFNQNQCIGKLNGWDLKYILKMKLGKLKQVFILQREFQVLHKGIEN